MYSVLERILQTDEGKVIVCEHDDDRNAQAIYTEFLAIMTSSTEAMMNSGTHLYHCGRSLVRKRPSKGVSITPEELGQTKTIESLPLQWRGDSVGQKRDGRFPMLGKD